MTFVLWAVAIAVIFFLPSRVTSPTHRIDHPAERFLRDREVSAPNDR